MKSSSFSSTFIKLSLLSTLFLSSLIGETSGCQCVILSKAGTPVDSVCSAPFGQVCANAGLCTYTERMATPGFTVTSDATACGTSTATCGAKGQKCLIYITSGTVVGPQVVNSTCTTSTDETMCGCRLPPHTWSNTPTMPGFFSTCTS